MSESTDARFVSRSIGRLAVGLLVTYALLALGCLAIGWPLRLASTYTAVAAIGGGLAMLVAGVRRKRIPAGGQAVAISDKPSFVMMAASALVGLLLIGTGLLLISKHGRQEGVLLLIGGAGVIVAYARKVVRFARAQ